MIITDITAQIADKAAATTKLPVDCMITSPFQAIELPDTTYVPETLVKPDVCPFELVHYINCLVVEVEIEIEKVTTASHHSIFFFLFF